MPGLNSTLSEKASKEATKEAKKMQKDGWGVAPGSVALDKISRECMDETADGG